MLKTMSTLKQPFLSSFFTTMGTILVYNEENGHPIRHPSIVMLFETDFFFLYQCHYFLCDLHPYPLP